MIQKLKVNNARITGDDLVVIVKKLNEVIDTINGNTKKPNNTTNKSEPKEDENVPKKPTKARKTSKQEG